MFRDKILIILCMQILHKGRLQGPVASTSEAQDLISNLNENKMLYGSPFGSNDDWYWIYATVKAGEMPPPFHELKGLRAP